MTTQGRREELPLVLRGTGLRTGAVLLPDLLPEAVPGGEESVRVGKEARGSPEVRTSQLREPRKGHLQPLRNL